MLLNWIMLLYAVWRGAACQSESTRLCLLIKDNKIISDVNNNKALSVLFSVAVVQKGARFLVEDACGETTAMAQEKKGALFMV